MLGPGVSGGSKVASATGPDESQLDHAQKIETRAWFPGVYPNSADTIASNLCSRPFQDVCPGEKVQTIEELSPAM